MGKALPLNQLPAWAQAIARQKLLQYPCMEKISWGAPAAALVPPRKLGAMCGGVETRAIVTEYGLPVVLTIEVRFQGGGGCRRSLWPANRRSRHRGVLHHSQLTLLEVLLLL
jgi:hypothetical protein